MPITPLADEDRERRAQQLYADYQLRFERLDQISRARALSSAESIELERVMQRLGMIKTHVSRRLAPGS